MEENKSNKGVFWFFIILTLIIIFSFIFLVVAIMQTDSSSSSSSYYTDSTYKRTPSSSSNYKGTGLSEQEMRDLKKGIEDNLGEAMGGQKLEGDLWNDL